MDAGENLKSNLSRFVVVVWVFVVLILQSSYTASLTSMLTVPQLEPAIRDYTSLWLGADKVGIMNNSFMRASMTKSGFPPSRLEPYRATHSFHEALLNGTIGAIVDETPYLRLFLKAYCDNFTKTAQTNKTGGFGFVSAHTHTTLLLMPLRILFSSIWQLIHALASGRSSRRSPRGRRTWRTCRGRS